LNGFVAEFAEAGGEEIDDTFFQCGDSTVASILPSVDLSRVQDMAMYSPMWSFSYSQKILDQSKQHATLISMTSCVFDAPQFTQTSYGYLFQGRDCAVKVVMEGESVTSIQYNDLPAISGCNWGFSTDLLRDFKKADLFETLARDAGRYQKDNETR